MIEIYSPYLALIILCAVGVGSVAGYLLGHGFKGGDKADTNQYNILLREEQRKREALRTELDLEIKHGKQLEGALETMINNEADRTQKTFTEMYKGHTKILIDPESPKAKIPVRKIFKRRKLGGR